MIGAFAVVTQEIPERHGVLVKFANASSSIDTGDESGAFVRVLARRAHPAGGSEIDLPQVGELGVVLELTDGHQVWIGSIHWQDLNQIDPSTWLQLRRHTSGVAHQTRRNGDMQLDHPSGLRITIAEAKGALAALQRKGNATLPPKGPVDIEVDHPSGLNIHIDNDGALACAFPAGGGVTIDKDGNFSAAGFSTMSLQDANARFCMEALFDYVKTHTHSGVTTGSGNSGAPSAPPPENSLSPSTFKGPHA